MVAKAACGGEAENWWSLSRHERSLDAPAKKDGVGAAGCTSGEGKKQSALWDGASAVQVETSTRLDGAECCDGKGRPTQTAGGENNAGAPPRSLTPQLGAIGAVGGEAGSLAPPPSRASHATPLFQLETGRDIQCHARCLSQSPSGRDTGHHVQCRVPSASCRPLPPLEPLEPLDQSPSQDTGSGPLGKVHSVAIEERASGLLSETSPPLGQRPSQETSPQDEPASGQARPASGQVRPASGQEEPASGPPLPQADNWWSVTRHERCG